MLFSNPFFFLFLAGVYLLYWALPLRTQNVLLLAASYIFYGLWDWRFLNLLFGVSVTAYLGGVFIHRLQSIAYKRIVLALVLLANLGCLAYFKYFNFFSATFKSILKQAGFHVSESTLAIVLPVGISFFTLRTLHYTLDVYKRKLEPSRDPISFLAYVAFFPQLIAGPIERAGNMLPQLMRERNFDPDKAVDSIGQIIWGLFQKVVVADNLALLVDASFNNITTTSGPQLLFATYCFTFQIYCDFAGYSNIALGCGRLLGFDLTQNFRYPYFAHSPAEFWRRWHITLSTWFRDYVYIPLGGSHGSSLRYAFTILITFSISGLWHGPNWTFVTWGLINGLFFLLFHWPDRRRFLRSNILNMVLTFHCIMLTWILFRADTISHATMALLKIMTPQTWVKLEFYQNYQILYAILLIAAFILMEWLQRERPHVLYFERRQCIKRASTFAVVLLSVLLLGRFTHTPFIYFQF